MVIHECRAIGDTYLYRALVISPLRVLHNRGFCTAVETRRRLFLALEGKCRLGRLGHGYGEVEAVGEHRQRAAICEHSVHVPNALGDRESLGQRRQGRAAVEHVVGVGKLVGDIWVGRQVNSRHEVFRKRLQLRAPVKHGRGARYGLWKGQAFRKRLELGASPEHQ